jgi:hypothetical protein
MLSSMWSNFLPFAALRTFTAVCLPKPFFTSATDFFDALALPVVSGTLGGALLKCPIFEGDEDDCDESNEFVCRADEVIFVAKKLRHPVLFRECFVHLVARLHDQDYMEKSLPNLRADNDIWRLLIEGQSRLRRRILQTQQYVLMSRLTSGYKLDLKTFGSGQFDYSKHPERLDCDNPEESASFFRCLLEEYKPFSIRAKDPWFEDEKLGDLLFHLESLLESKLVLDRTGFGAGQGPYESCFLCTDLSDADMPWDSAQVDW